MKKLFAHVAGVLFLSLIRAKVIYPANEILIGWIVGFAVVLSVAALSTAFVWILFNPEQRKRHIKSAFIISLWFFSIALVIKPFIS